MFNCIKVLFAFISIQPLWATLNLDYYPEQFIIKIEANQLKNQELKEDLFKLLSYYHIKSSNKKDLLAINCPTEKNCYKQKSNMTYKQARKYMFGKLFLQKSKNGYYVKDLYCQKKYSEADGIGPMKIPSNKKINCEHTWPQSRFSNNFPKNIQKNDLHHLFPVNNRANSSRSNHIFSEVKGRAVNEKCTASYKGKVSGTSITAFEPPMEHQGNVARALFYFSVRYQINIGPLEEKFLRKWHELDPVDRSEEIRNNQIFKIQRSRNPFIDAPELVYKIKDF